MGLYIQMHSMHGLFRSKNIELGRDEDTGGQIVYVLELAKALGKLAEVDKVDIVTRRIVDPSYPGYSKDIEKVSEKVNIVRIECGPKRYIMKVNLWPYLEEFIDNTKKYIKELGRKPDILHSNYADSGYVCMWLSQDLDISQVHTGHSLGKPKMERLRALGPSGLSVSEYSFENMDEVYHFTERLRAEQLVIDHANAIVVSTAEELNSQYGMYDVDLDDKRFHIIPPGVPAERFFPTTTSSRKEFLPARCRLEGILQNELAKPEKPIIFTISRLDSKKNLITLVRAYCSDIELQRMANLVIVTGSLTGMSPSQQQLMDEIEGLIVKHRLDEKVCIIKHLLYDSQGGEVYRLVYDSKGLFVNPALHEPFGITVIEAAITGVPVVVTNNGGPVEIVKQCRCGVLTEPTKPEKMAKAIRKILSDTGLWEQYSRHGIKEVKKRYSWDATAAREVELFKRLLQKKRKTDEKRKTNSIRKLRSTPIGTTDSFETPVQT